MKSSSQEKGVVVKTTPPGRTWGREGEEGGEERRGEEGGKGGDEGGKEGRGERQGEKDERRVGTWLVQQGSNPYRMDESNTINPL